MQSLVLIEHLCKEDKAKELYEKELDSFESEQKYQEYIENSLFKLSCDINEKVDKANNMLKLFKVNTSESYNKMIFKQYFEGRTYLKICTNTSYFDSFKYLCGDLYNIPKELSRYIKNITGSKFLSLIDDLNKIDLNDSTVKILNNNAIKVSYSLFSMLCPLYLNNKETVSIEIDGVVFRVPNNISIHLLDYIHSYLKSYKNIDFNNYEIKLFKVDRVVADNYIEYVDIPYNNKFKEKLS